MCSPKNREKVRNQIRAIRDLLLIRRKEGEEGSLEVILADLGICLPDGVQERAISRLGDFNEGHSRNHSQLLRVSARTQEYRQERCGRSDNRCVTARACAASHLSLVGHATHCLSDAAPSRQFHPNRRYFHRPENRPALREPPGHEPECSLLIEHRILPPTFFNTTPIHNGSLKPQGVTQ